MYMYVCGVVEIMCLPKEFCILFLCVTYVYIPGKMLIFMCNKNRCLRRSKDLSQLLLKCSSFCIGWGEQGVVFYDICRFFSAHVT